MKNNTKLIMETWRRYLKEGPQDSDMLEDEEEFVDDGSEQYTDDWRYETDDDETSGYQEKYTEDLPDPLDPYEEDESDDSLDDSGRSFQERYGQYEDPEMPVEGEPLVDDDLSGDMPSDDIMNRFTSDEDEDLDYEPEF